MPDKETELPIRKKRRKKRRSFASLYLFAIVFLIALYVLTNVIKSYSPDIDVSIGANQDITLSDSDMDVEVKSVDERLKWIQMEDDMPTVSVKESELNKDVVNDFDDINVDVVTPKQENNIEKNVIKNPPKPSMEEVVNNKDFRNTSTSVKQVIPKPTHSITKVYLGNYSSIEEAMKIQSKVSAEDPSLMPFVKAVNNTYIVQLGSFSDSAKADNLIENLKSKGYSPKTIYEN